MITKWSSQGASNVTPSAPAAPMAVAMAKASQREPARKPRSRSKLLSSIYSGMKRRAADDRPTSESAPIISTQVQT